VLIVVEDGASLTLRETSTADDFCNVAFDIVLGTNARLEHVRETGCQSETVRVSDYSLRIGQSSSYRTHFADFGGKLSRTELHIALEGEGARAHLSGVSVLGEGGHADVTTRIAHAVGGTQSTQLFKIIAGEKSRGVYQGKISVAEGANGSDSRQAAKGLLLGERAEIDLKPELEILADDVKCAHGAAVGDLDPESLFYLRSRGVPEGEARALLMRAFLEDAVAEIADESIRAELWSRVESALQGLSA
jgi:Fe-S cluster assembly protein SufD